MLMPHDHGSLLFWTQMKLLLDSGFKVIAWNFAASKSFHSDRSQRQPMMMTTHDLWLTDKCRLKWKDSNNARQSAKFYLIDRSDNWQIVWTDVTILGSLVSISDRNEGAGAMWKNGFYISTESDDNDFTGMIRHQRYTFMCGVGKIFLEQNQT